MRWWASAQSPADHTPSMTVRWWSSTVTAPDVPSGMPASAARRVAGRLPRGQHYNVRLDALVKTPRSDDLAIATLEALNFVFGDHFDPHFLETVADFGADVGIKCSLQDRRHHGDDGGFEADRVKSFGHLQSDVSTSDDNCLAGATCRNGPKSACIIEGS